MAYSSKQYSRINWQNRPSTSTALGATNLNHMDVFLNTVDNALVTMEAAKLNISTAYGMLASLTIDTDTGIIRATQLDGTVYTWDLNIEKIPISFTLSEDGILTMTTDDGTQWTCNVAELIKDYVYEDSDTIGFTKTFNTSDDSYHVTAIVKEGSIGSEHLDPDYRADIQTYMNTAQTAANDALTYSKDSKRYAVGDSAYEGSETDNAKYYYEQALEAQTAAKTSETNAATSETNAKASETAAATSETNAKTSETNAKTSETNAKTSETNAKTSETNAKASETAAATSEANAKASEENLATAEANAKASADAAAVSETNAAASAAQAQAIAGFDGSASTVVATDTRGLVGTAGETSNVQSLIDVIANNIPYVTPEMFGAVGDGVTDDTQAIQDAVDSGKIVLFDGKTYSINSNISLDSGTVLYGILNQTILMFNNASILVEGSSKLNSGTHKKQFLFRNIRFYKENGYETIPFIIFKCCDYFKIENCFFIGTGRQLLLWEAFDSRIINTDFEYGGIENSNDNPAIEFRSTDGGLGGETLEYTNNIYFYGCRFESHQGCCLKTTGENTNKLYFQNCKFESLLCYANAILFANASNIAFNDCVFVGSKLNPYNYVHVTSCSDVIITGYGEHLVHQTGDFTGKRLFYLQDTARSNKFTINLQMNTHDLYEVDYKTFGIDFYSNEMFFNGHDITVNQCATRNLVISNRTLEFGSLEDATEYTMPSEGYFLINCVASDTNYGYVDIKNNTTGYNARLYSIEQHYGYIMVPVNKDDIIVVNKTNIAYSYGTFYYKYAMIDS